MLTTYSSVKVESTVYLKTVPIWQKIDFKLDLVDVIVAKLIVCDRNIYILMQATVQIFNPRPVFKSDQRIARIAWEVFSSFSCYKPIFPINSSAKVFHIW